MTGQLVSLVLTEGGVARQRPPPQSLQTFAGTQLKMKNKIISRKARLLGDHAFYFCFAFSFEQNTN